MWMTMGKKFSLISQLFPVTIEFSTIKNKAAVGDFA